MGVTSTMGKAAGRASRKLALRNKWLARRLWMVMVAEVLLTSRRHWKRLDDRERARLVYLARKSQGRPAKNLSARERREADRLLEKLGHVELAESVAGIVLPFRPLSRLATRLAFRAGGARRAGAEGEPGAQAGGAPASPAESS